MMEPTKKELENPRRSPTKMVTENTRFTPIGFGNFIAQNRIIEVTRFPNYLVQIGYLRKVEEAGLLITMTFGRRTHSIIQMDSGHHILSYLTPEEIQQRLISNGPY